MEEQRIQKLVSNYGNYSRRDLEYLIKQGKVTRNGKIVTLGEKASVDDEIIVNGKRVSFNLKHDYFVVNKPKGYLSETKDKYGKSVISLINNYKERNLFTIGRLDVLTTGLIVVTNDGYLSNYVTSPKNNIRKTYLVWIKGSLNKKSFLNLKTGIVLDDGYKTKPIVKWKTIYENKEEDKLSCYKITITEGKKNQIRRMFKAVDKEVINLKRVSIESLTLENIESGSYRKFKKEEIYNLLNVKKKG